MPRFFIDKTDISDGAVTLTKDAASHIALSLRMAVGDTLILCDSEGYDYTARIETVSPDAVLLSVLQKEPSRSEPPYCIRLYQCLPKGDKFESIIQKSVECGVCEIVPVQSSRCIAKLKPEDTAKKLVRFNRIAEEAAKQSGRGRIPKILAPMSFKAAIGEMAKDGLSFLCYENEDGKTLAACLRESEKPSTVSFLIGPEGGLAPEEVELAKENGILSLSLGERILRTETAAPFVLAILSAFYEL